jgi:hypothetical protein
MTIEHTDSKENFQSFVFYGWNLFSYVKGRVIGWEKVQRGIFGPKREKVMLVGGRGIKNLI